MSVVVIKRPPRVYPPEVPNEEVRLEAPPELPRGEDQGLLMNLLPMLGMGSSAAFFFLPTGSGTSGGFMKVMGVLMLGSTVAMVVAQIVRARKGPSGQMAEARRDYLKYLAQVRRGVRKTARLQRDAQYYLHPAPEQLWALVAESSRVWERRFTDPDFAQVRVGLGPQQLSTPLVAPETAPVDELEPLTAHSMQQFIAAHGSLDNLPLAVGLRSFYHVTVSGDPDTVYGQTRSIVGQLCSLHSPEDLVVAIVAAPGAQPEWEWVKWLPHAQHQEHDGAGSRRLICGDLGEVEDLLADELEGRPRFNREGQPVLDQPHVVIVLDGGGVPHGLGDRVGRGPAGGHDPGGRPRRTGRGARLAVDPGVARPAVPGGGGRRPSPACPTCCPRCRRSRWHGSSRPCGWVPRTPTNRCWRTWTSPT